jgi:RluA family pseudouridine synthase
MIFLLVGCASFHKKNILQQALSSQNEKIKNVMNRPEDFEVQIIYTQITRIKNNEIKFKDYTYNLDAKNYFYPASTVKLPIAILALEKLSSIKNTSINSEFSIDGNLEKFKFWQEISKVFAVSDNDASNHLLEFLGFDYLNKTMADKGLSNFYVTHRVSTPDSGNPLTKGITLYKDDNSVIAIPAINSQKLASLQLKKIKKEEEKLIPNPEMVLDIISENDDFIIINKPAGTQVHPDFNEKTNTIANGLIAAYPEIAKLEDDHTYSYQSRPGIVHRLDKETSGILIIAKNKKSFLEFKKMFKEKTITKKYLAIVYGVPQNKKGVIDQPLARTTNYRKQTIANRKTKTKVREAVTNYKLVKTLGDDFSLLEVSPQTGRTHQIRVHLCFIGHPIVGDNLYRKKLYERYLGAKRHMLHASEIKFELFGTKYSFKAPAPKDFDTTKAKLSKPIIAEDSE